MRGQWALDIIAEEEFKTILDIGTGKGELVDYFGDSRQVTVVDISLNKTLSKDKRITALRGDYVDTQFDKQFDVIWCSHVLEHQLDVQTFLEKIFYDLKDGGILAITVPFLKHSIVGGHVSLWNTGLLLYRLVLAGFDCSLAIGQKQNNEICVLVRKKRAQFNKNQLLYDKGDIETLGNFFPFQAIQGFDGNIGSFGDIKLFKSPAKKYKCINVMTYSSFIGVAIINYSNMMKKLGHNVTLYDISGYYISPSPPLHATSDDGNSVELEGGINIIRDTSPTLEKIEKFIDDNDIDIIIKHADFRPFSIEFSNLIKFRNHLHDNGGLRNGKKPVDIFHVEGGFLRPGLAQIDPDGCNGDSSLAKRGIETIPEITHKEEEDLRLWLKKYHTAKIPQEYNRQIINKILNIPDDHFLIFCPLQVDYDSVLKYYTLWCNTSLEFVTTVQHLVQCISEATGDKISVVFKKHPKQQLTRASEKFLPQCNATILEANHPINTGSLLKNSDSVWVVNSTAGCEALTWHQKVLCFGFSAWGKAGVVHNLRFRPDAYNRDTILTNWNHFKKYPPNVRNIDKLLYHIIFRESWSNTAESLKKVVNHKARYIQV